MLIANRKITDMYISILVIVHTYTHVYQRVYSSTKSVRKVSEFLNYCANANVERIPAECAA
jgi:hypothetical protein